MSGHVNGQAVDLEALDTKAGSNEGFWLRLRHPKTNRPLPARVKLLGIDSDRYRDKGTELWRRRQQELAEDPRGRLEREETDARAIELLAAVTAGWDGLKLKGEELAFKGEASARDLYTRWPWIYEQAQQAVLDRGNFLPGSDGG